MKWIEVKIRTTAQAYDAISEMLISMGCGGVAVEDPHDIMDSLRIPGCWDYIDDSLLNRNDQAVVIRAYFPGDMEKDSLVGTIKEKVDDISGFLDTGEGYAGFSEVDDDDWANSWKKYYKPFHITESVVIKPSWEEYASSAQETVIEIDPGMAFGTGTHETTAMCAQMLERYLKRGDTVIDVGCGSGILSVIAAKLGAREITAVDTDGTAVAITIENSRLNGITGGIRVFKGELKHVKCVKADIIIANIIADVIIDISHTVRHLLKKEGLMIASGIIRDRKHEVLKKYTDIGFTCEATEETGEWVAVAFKWRNSL